MELAEEVVTSTSVPSQMCHPKKRKAQAVNTTSLLCILHPGFWSTHTHTQAHTHIHSEGQAQGCFLISGSILDRTESVLWNTCWGNGDTAACKCFMSVHILLIRVDTVDKIYFSWVYAITGIKIFPFSKAERH